MIRLLANGVEHPLGETISSAERYVFLSPLPYARKIERVSKPPHSDQAAQGVFGIVATLANKRFGNIACIWPAPTEVVLHEVWFLEPSEDESMPNKKHKPEVDLLRESGELF